MLLAYAATKAAIVNITKGLSQQVIARGIRVNAVAPGPRLVIKVGLSPRLGEAEIEG